MARPNRSAEIDAALLQAVGQHPRDLVGMVAAQLGLSTARISMQVRALVAGGYLYKLGTTRPTCCPCWSACHATCWTSPSTASPR